MKKLLTLFLVFCCAGLLYSTAAWAESELRIVNVTINGSQMPKKRIW